MNQHLPFFGNATSTESLQEAPLKAIKQRTGMLRNTFGQEDLELQQEESKLLLN